MRIPDLKKEIGKLRGQKIHLNRQEREVLATVDAHLDSVVGYVDAQVQDLKLMMTALMLQVEALSASSELTTATQNSLDNLRTACQLMAAKVDNTATPVTSFVSTFNNNI